MKTRFLRRNITVFQRTEQPQKLEKEIEFIITKNNGIQDADNSWILMKICQAFLSGKLEILVMYLKLQMELELLYWFNHPLLNKFVLSALIGSEPHEYEN